MIKKIMLASCLLVASMASQAALISFNGYERDTAKNYVTGGGLEWLMWDVTRGMSINSALTSYASQGWRLASNAEMAVLINTFMFGPFHFTNSESEYQGTSRPWNEAESSNHLVFISMFGNTNQSVVCTASRPEFCSPSSDMYLGSLGLYGSDDNNDGQYKLAEVFDDSTFIFNDGNKGYNDHWAGLTHDWIDRIDNREYVGVALVREQFTDPSKVPTPGSIGLLALGLLALGYRRRQVLGR